MVSANVSFQMFNAFSLCCPLSYFVLLNPGLHEDPGESNNLKSFARQKNNTCLILSPHKIAKENNNAASSKMKLFVGYIFIKGRF